MRDLVFSASCANGPHIQQRRCSIASKRPRECGQKAIPAKSRNCRYCAALTALNRTGLGACWASRASCTLKVHCMLVKEGGVKFQMPQLDESTVLVAPCSAVGEAVPM